MSTIFRDADGHPTGSLPMDDGDCACCLCGKPADGFWQGRTQVGVCVHCAVYQLPKLIADAVRADGSYAGIFQTYEPEIRLTYWKAAASALTIKPANWYGVNGRVASPTEAKP